MRRCIPEYSFFRQLDHNIVRISFLFKGGWGVNFYYLPRRGESEKLKKEWKYGPGEGHLKRGEAGTFPISFFQGLSFLHLEIALPFAKLCYAFEKKKFFSVTIIL